MIIIALNQALCDESDEVRIQAAKAFQTLFRSVGAKAFEQVSPQNYDLPMRTSASNLMYFTLEYIYILIYLYIFMYIYTDRPSVA